MAHQTSIHSSFREAKLPKTVFRKLVSQMNVAGVIETRLCALKSHFRFQPIYLFFSPFTHPLSSLLREVTFRFLSSLGKEPVIFLCLQNAMNIFFGFV